MKTLLLFIIALLVGCNSQEPKLSSIQGQASGITAPYILSVSSLTANGNYTTGTIDFEVRFSETVHVLGVPSISVMTGVGPRYATYRSGSGTDTLIFKLNVIASITDNDGISLLSPINLNGGSIYDIVENEDSLLTFTAPNTSGITLNHVVIVPDGVNPQILSIAMTTPTKYSYKPASDPNPVIVVTFSENVTVNIGGVLPYIPLTIGSTTANATFLSYDGSNYNKLKFMLVTSAATPIDLDGVTFGTDIVLADSSIKDQSGMPINTLLTPIAKPKMFIIPETLRDWYDANDTITTGSSFIQAFSKSSAQLMNVYGGVTLTSSSPKTFQFTDGSSLIADETPRIWKVLIVYKLSSNPTATKLFGPYNYNSSGGCYTDYLGNEICSSLAGGVSSMSPPPSLIPDEIAIPSVDYGITFFGGKFRLGPDCIAAGIGCAWYNPYDVTTGERLDTAMDGDGVLTNPDYDPMDGTYKYSIATFSGTSFRPMFGDLGFQQEIAEVMFFDDGFSTASSSTDMTAIESYLTSKYGTISAQ